MLPYCGLAGWFPVWAILSNATMSLFMHVAGSFCTASPQGVSSREIAESAGATAAVTASGQPSWKEELLALPRGELLLLQSLMAIR